jgi:hypothetical protein
MKAVYSSNTLVRTNQGIMHHEMQHETSPPQKPQTLIYDSLNLWCRGKWPNMGRCIISYQEVLSSLVKNVNHQADEALLCNYSISGQLLRTSVLSGRLCFGAL